MTTAATSAGLALSELVARLARFGARLHGDGAVRVVDIRHDSRQVQPGGLFVARAGGKSPASAHVPDALARGARAILIERGTPLPDVAVPVIEVNDARRAMGFAAEALFGEPTRALGVVGITGTNGKTTSSFLVQHAVSRSGGRAARLGTLGYQLESDVVPSPLTTPEADEVSRLAARARDGGASHLVMEASSHALSQGRVDAVHFAVAGFTNLTQDHLDFHGSMRAYADAKLRLFTELSPGVSVINADDDFGREIAAKVRGRVIRYGRDASFDVRPAGVSVDERGVRGTLRVLDRDVGIETRLTGEHNLDNLLLSLGIVAALGLDVEAAAAGFAQAPQVPGRLERCDAPEDDLLVLVDYAHTPDALARALAAVRPLSNGTLWCVFGCGGDRDPEKRPKMGDAVGRGADRAVITNDNPRSERAEAIAEAIEPGLSAHGRPYEVELDRARAIERAVLAAAPGDVVLIAGKGHETYQIIGAERRDFDDRVEARRALALRRARGSG